MPDAVFNIEAAAPSHISALSFHCAVRKSSGTSAIDPARSHLNERLYGSGETINDALADWYQRTGAKRPTKQAERPYFRLVLGASPEFFRDPGNTEAFRDASLAWLKAEFGDDLVHAELHLDETTPHIHAVIAPTYERKRRTPGKMKAGETPEEFEARKAAAKAAPGERTVARTSSRWGAEGSFDMLRHSFVAGVAHLGIGYGQKRGVEAPEGESKSDYLKRLQTELFEREIALKAKETALEARKAQIETVAARVQELRSQLVLDRNEHAEQVQKLNLRDEKAREILNRERQTLESGLVEVENAMVDIDRARTKAMDAVSRFEKMMEAVQAALPVPIWQRIQGFLNDLREAFGISGQFRDMAKASADQARQNVQDTSETRKFGR